MSWEEKTGNKGRKREGRQSDRQADNQDRGRNWREKRVNRWRDKEEGRKERK